MSLTHTHIFQESYPYIVTHTAKRLRSCLTRDHAPPVVSAATTVWQPHALQTIDGGCSTARPYIWGHSRAAAQLAQLVRASTCVYSSSTPASTLVYVQYGCVRISSVMRSSENVGKSQSCMVSKLSTIIYTVRLKIIGNDIIKNVGKYESCMVSKLPIIFKRTRIYMCV